MQKVNDYELGEVLPPDEIDAIQDNAAGIAQIPYSLVGAPYMYCDTSPNIKIGGIRGVLLPGHPNSNLSNVTEISFDATTGGALAADTWYYVYATSSAGVISIGKTTTPPDNGLIAIGADQRYLGCFKTRQSAATILSFRMVRGRYIYQTSDHPIGEFDAINPGTASSYTAVPLAKWVPPHSRLAILSLTLISDSTNRRASFRTGTDGSGSHIYITHSLPNTDEISRDPDFILDASQNVYYQVTPSGGGQAIIRVSGFCE